MWSAIFVSLMVTVSSLITSNVLESRREQLRDDGGERGGTMLALLTYYQSI